MKKITFSIMSFLFIGFMQLHAQEGEFLRSYTGLKKVNLDIQNGELKVTRSISGDLEVHGRFDATRLKIKADQMGDKLLIKEDNNRLKSNTRSSWTMAVPEGINVTFNIGAGEVTIEGVNVDLNGNSGGANVQMNKISGTSNINSGSGNISVVDASGIFKINTGTGDVSCANSNGSISANTGAGDIYFDRSTGAIEANTGTGDIKAERVSIHKPSFFNTGTGDVEVTLGSGAKADLKLNSGTGLSSLNFNGNAFDGTLTMSCDSKKGEIVSPFRFDEERGEEEGGNPVVYKIKRFGEFEVNIKSNAGEKKAIVKK